MTNCFRHNYDNLQSKSCIINRIYDENNKYEDLKHFTKLSWDIYSNRLGDESNDFYRAGKNEFDLNNNEIIRKVLEMDIPKKISLSVTSDKSLHYTFRFNDFVLFIETYLSLEFENETYIEFFKDKELILEGHFDIEDGLGSIFETYKKRGGKTVEFIPSLLDACGAE